MILDDYLWSRLWQRWLLLLGVMVIILYSIDFLATPSSLVIVAERFFTHHCVYSWCRSYV